MTTIGTFEAKNRWFALLERVEHGEEITITRRGRPIARLVPTSAAPQADVAAVIDKLKTLRKGSSLGGLSWKELRDAGRR